MGKDDDALAGIMDGAQMLGEAPSSWSVYFQVEDTDATLQKVEQLGGATVVPAMDSPYGRLATATDVTGAVFKLVG
jgi:predicted enzyme related to lactoylglutathione lyase